MLAISKVPLTLIAAYMLLKRHVIENLVSFQTAYQAFYSCSDFTFEASVMLRAGNSLLYRYYSILAALAYGAFHRKI